VKACNAVPAATFVMPADAAIFAISSSFVIVHLLLLGWTMDFLPLTIAVTTFTWTQLSENTRRVRPLAPGGSDSVSRECASYGSSS
jgi:hypothetical protein